MNVGGKGLKLSLLKSSSEPHDLLSRILHTCVSLHGWWTHSLLGAASQSKGWFHLVQPANLACSFMLHWLSHPKVLHFWTTFYAYHMQTIIGTASFLLSWSIHKGADSYHCTTISWSPLSLCDPIWLKSLCMIPSATSTTILDRCTLTFA